MSHMFLYPGWLPKLVPCSAIAPGPVMRLQRLQQRGWLHVDHSSGIMA
jgi:hypothetical protein